MRKCIVISDSFKGTLSSLDICAIARECFREADPSCELITVPVADGGEGTTACFRQVCGGQMVPVRVQGPYGRPMEAAYLLLPDGRAVIETASCAGLPLVGEERDPLRTTTYGVGEQIRHAVDQGCREILLGLGGSCTNDGGCGCAAALGVRFLDEQGRAFVPVGGTLSRVRTVDPGPARDLLRGVKLTGMCDIDNPMHGPAGAAYVFGPQKGADPETVERLDEQLKALDRTIVRELGCSVAQTPGAGAAGAFGAGILAFLGGRLRPGIEAVLDLVGFDRMLPGCDAVITGEGRLDSQSFRGKVVSGVSRRAKAQAVPVIVLAGSVLPEAEEACARPELGISAVFSINRQAMAFSASRGRSRENYRYALLNILRLLRLGQP